MIRGLAIAAAAASLALGPATFSPCLSAAAAQSYACCKICTKGKACGNSCIARWKTCHKGRGCACNG
ncbi:MAG TPA: hypothetical protein VEA61_07675 [Allosphingosinicella sp.]|nr:hypothetical protein [Allosphingosinicella sp.]